MPQQTAEQVPDRGNGRSKNLRGGSRKGRPNKFSKIIKTEVLASFGMVGGRDYLVQQARQNPVAYMNLLGKVIPQQAHAETGGLTVHVLQLVEPAVPIPGVLASPIAGHVWREPTPAALALDASDATELA